MNWQDKSNYKFPFKIWLAICLLPALFHYGCQSEGDNISSSTLVRQDELRVIFTDTFTINCFTFLRDSINTTVPTNYLSGDFSAPEYGRSTCNSFFQVLLKGNIFVPGPGTMFDSMVLVLDPNYSYGATDGTINIGVHRLKEDLFLDSTYYYFDEVGYDNIPMAEASFTVDAIRSSALRIRLDALGMEFLENSENNEFAEEYFTSSKQFVKYFKGIALVTNFSENSIVGFAPEDGVNLSQTGLYLYSHFLQDTTSISQVYKFPISIDGTGFNQITSARPSELSTLKTEGLLIPSTQSANAAYVQAGTGVLSQLDIPDIDKLKTQYENVIVTRAEILVPSVSGDFEYYSPPGTIFMFKSDGNQQVVDFEFSSFGEVGTGILVGDDYLIDITGYFQSLIQGTELKTSYLLLPSLNGSSVNQLIFNDQSHLDEPIRLLVYYIPIN